jgi:hypothetical protein
VSNHAIARRTIIANILAFAPDTVLLLPESVEPGT